MPQPTMNGDTANTQPEGEFEPLTRLPFPPVTKQHIVNCSFPTWYPKYRSIAPKARLLPCPDAFLDYLRSDGIVLPEDGRDEPEWSDKDSGIEEDAHDDDDDDTPDVAAPWRDFHEKVKDTIAELGGKVVPKMNWSAPKDATWINYSNSMDCTTPDDVYLLLKSSDFVTHDLDHAFDDTDDAPENEDGSKPEDPTSPLHLVLRKWAQINPSLEFRCFVRNRKLIAMCQRDLNHFEFLSKMQDETREAIEDFFEEKLKNTFADPNFVFDVYIPPPHNRVWLIDVNPWAPRTDPLLFSWMELLTMPEPPSDEADSASESGEDKDYDEVVRFFIPELRLVKHDDPEAYNFSTQQYSAHKMPKDVVDASRSGGSDLKEFAQQWQEAQRLAEEQKAEDLRESEQDRRAQD